VGDEGVNRAQGYPLVTIGQRIDESALTVTHRRNKVARVGRRKRLRASDILLAERKLDIADTLVGDAQQLCDLGFSIYALDIDQELVDEARQLYLGFCRYRLDIVQKHET
jgi:hypothetical protein